MPNLVRYMCRPLEELYLRSGHAIPWENSQCRFLDAYQKCVAQETKQQGGSPLLFPLCSFCNHLSHERKVSGSETQEACAPRLSLYACVACVCCACMVGATMGSSCRHKNRRYYRAHADELKRPPPPSISTVVCVAVRAAPLLEWRYPLLRRCLILCLLPWLRFRSPEPLPFPLVVSSQVLRQLLCLLCLL